VLAAAVVAACGGGAEDGISGSARSTAASAGTSGAREIDRPGAPSDGARPTETSAAPETVLAVPAAPGSAEPRLTVGADGEVVLSWLEPDGEGSDALRFAKLDEAGWSEARSVASGDDFFANWADLPSVLPITAQLYAAHWLQLSPEDFSSYDIMVALSKDGGTTWTPGAKLNSDHVLAEHGFVTLFPWRDAVGAVWLDGRELEAGAESADADGTDAASRAGDASGTDDANGDADAAASDPPAGTTLRYGTIAADGTATDLGEIDSLVCDCCQTGVAVSATGPVVIYRNRTADEIRDVAVRRNVAGAWTDPVVLGPDGWRIDGCPVNGPAIAADGDDVAAAWFTAADDASRVRAARSTDGGKTFGRAIDVDGDGSFGYVDVVLLDDGASIVSWWRRAGDGRIALAARRIEKDGRLGDLRIVTENDTPRPLDMPQMAAAGERLIFAWTDAAEPAVKSVAVPVW
jgi:hypothetical protein